MQKSKYQEYRALSQQMFKRFKEIYNSKKWEKFADKPCDMFKMEIEGRIASKGQIIVNYPMQQIFQSLRDHNHLKGTDPLLNTYEYLQQFKEDSHLYTQYLRYNNVLVVAGRDFVVLTRSIQEGNIIYFFAESLPNYPKPQEKGIVRGHIITGGHILQKIDDKRTKVTYISDIDLKGMIPQFVKNIISQKQGQIVSRIEDYMKKQNELKK